MPRYAFRALRADEVGGWRHHGLSAKNPKQKQHDCKTMTDAVVSGKPSQYIHLTKSRWVALYFAEEHQGFHKDADSGHTIALIDLDKVFDDGKGSSWFDCSDGNYMESTKAENFAWKQEIYLVMRHIPPHAIVATIDTSKWTYAIWPQGRSMDAFQAELPSQVRQEFEGAFAFFDVELHTYADYACQNKYQSGFVLDDDRVGSGAHKEVFKAEYSNSRQARNGNGVFGVTKYMRSGEVFDSACFLEDLRSAKQILPYIKAFLEYAQETHYNLLWDLDIKMNIPAVWKREDDGQYCLMEPFIRGFRKWNSNTTQENTGEAMIANAFTHFTYHHSHGDMMINDIQGGKTGAKQYVLSDVAVQSVGRRFGVADLGEKGMETWFSCHMCNKFCDPSWRMWKGAKRRFQPTMGTTLAHNAGW